MTTQTATPGRSTPWLAPFRAIRPLLRTPSGAIAFFGVVFFLVVTIAAPSVIPNPKVNVDTRLLPPSSTYLLGTDFQGKDILILLLRGGRDVVLIAMITGILTTTVAVTLGSLAAYLGGWIDSVITFIGNFILTIPYLILVSVLAAFIHLDSPYLLALLLSALLWPSLMRTIRAQVFSLREREYVEAAVGLDLGTFHIIFREILPNMASYILIHLIFAMTNAIYAQIGLLFLGLAPITGMNWGVMITTAQKQGAFSSPSQSLWLLAPVFTISLLQWSLITLARSIEDAFNPRLKSGG